MQGPVKINDQLSVAGQITADEVAALKSQGFAAIINNRPDNEEPGQPSMAAVKATAEKAGLQYFFQPVTTSSIKKADVVAFHNALGRGTKPILAYCRSGTRCYLLWGLSQTMFENASPLQIVARAAQQGFDLRVLPALAEKLQAEK